VEGAAPVPGCSAWEPIARFRSPGEFERFRHWLEARVEDGTAEWVPVERSYGGGNTDAERWIRCRETGETWRVLAPDPPGYALFDRV
jgi:hypothetical protein